MTDRYDIIKSEACFLGTYGDLRKIVADEKNGVWEDLGLAKRFQGDDDEYDDDDDDDNDDDDDEDESDEIESRNNGITTGAECSIESEAVTWWSDTGDLLFRYYLEEDYRYRRSGYREGKKTSRPKQRWTPVKPEKMPVTSLPEMFFRDPMGFFARQDRKGFEGVYEKEAEEIVRKASAIAVPRPLTRNTVVIHQFGPNNEYRGFYVGSRIPKLERYRGTEVVTHSIDLRLPYIWKGGAKSGTDLLAVSLMREFDKVSTRVWDRKGCEEFFNADELFSLA